MTQEIEREWDASNADFATRWRSAMVSIGRVYFSEAVADSEFRAKINGSVKGANERQEMLKDALLIEAAADTDRRVISCDDTVRRLYRRVAPRVDELREIVWVNPTKTADEEPIPWLESGAPAEAQRTLGIDGRATSGRTDAAVGWVEGGKGELRLFAADTVLPLSWGSKGQGPTATTGWIAFPWAGWALRKRLLTVSSTWHPMKPRSSPGRS